MVLNPPLVHDGGPPLLGFVAVVRPCERGASTFWFHSSLHALFFIQGVLSGGLIPFIILSLGGIGGSSTQCCLGGDYLGVFKFLSLVTRDFGSLLPQVK
jgi:hypothetical protein